MTRRKKDGYGSKMGSSTKMVCDYNPIEQDHFRAIINPVFTISDPLSI